MSGQFAAGLRPTPVHDLVSTGGGLWIYPVQGPITGAKTEAEARNLGVVN